MTRRRQRRTRTAGALLLALVAALLASSAEAAEPAIEPELAELSPTEREWLVEVAALLTEEERAAFSSLRHGYQRQRFIEQFWRTRDPFPDTQVNEFRDEWERRKTLAAEKYAGVGTERGQAVLLAGPPTMIHPHLCPALLDTNEVWVYRTQGSRDVVLLFRLGPGGDDPYRLWHPQEGLSSLVSWSRAPTDAIGESDLRRQLARRCGRARETLALLTNATDLDTLLELTARLPEPSPEWVGTFLGRTTDVPEDAEPLAARLELDFPGSYKSRTIVQGLIVVSAGAALASSGPAPTFNLLIDGEVLRGEELFETFRYRFDLPAEGLTDTEIPLLVRRHLRAGPYQIVVRVRDLNADRYFHTRRKLRVPRVAAGTIAVTGGPVAAGPDAAPREDPTASPGPAAVGAETLDPPIVAAMIDLPEPEPGAATTTTATPAPTDNARALLAAARPTGEEPESEHILKILPLPDTLMTGPQRVDTSVSGDGVAKVTFFLDGRKVITKRRPPYSLEIDFGKAPRTHILDAVAYAGDGAELARDQVPVNAGPQRFAVRLLEPREGQRYAGSLQAHAEVDLPRGEDLERVEFYLNERKLATLYQPPFVQPVLLPRDEDITYVRAVAVLDDGHSAEDLVVINGPTNLEAMQVDFVELYTSVLDRRGNNIEGLELGDFRVFENQIEQQIRRFERVVDLPINATVVLDASLSMQEEMPEAEEAVLGFFEGVVEPKDRAAVIVFNDRPDLRVPLTNNHEVLAGGLSGVEPDGETALYDSIIYGLYYLAGLRGKRALIVLSDGEDSISKYTFDEALEFARHSGTAVYTIGLGLPNREQMVRARLRRLATETGGAHFSISRARELEQVYERIEAELRSQYLIAYQSSLGGDTGFREVEVAIGRRDLDVKTIPGYFP